MGPLKRKWLVKSKALRAEKTKVFSGKVNGPAKKAWRGGPAYRKPGKKKHKVKPGCKDKQTGFLFDKTKKIGGKENRKV